MKYIYQTIGIIIVYVLIGFGGQKSVAQSTGNNAIVSENEPHTHTDYFGAYNLEDEIFGTKTTVKIDGDQRIMSTNSLPNHKTGDFPNKGNPNTISAQNKTYIFPINPKYTGKSIWAREPGIALNGIKFEPGTAEVVVCDTGESYRVEAFQDLINLGLDFNHAHVQPTGAYHYHGAPTSVIEEFDTGEDLVHIGFAKDGFPIYFSKSNAYKPSYKLIVGDREGEDCTYTRPGLKVELPQGDSHDGTFTSDFEYVKDFGDLDECNGITINGKYMYLVTNAFPYVSRCLMGEVKEEERQGPPRGQRQREGQRPSSAELMERMDANKDGKLSVKEAKGPLQQDFNRVDTNADGYLSKEELEKAQKDGKRTPQNRRKQTNKN